MSDLGSWDLSQESFIRESLERDADWSEVIAQLDSMHREFQVNLAQINRGSFYARHCHCRN